MPQPASYGRDLRVQAERYVKYRGTARVGLEALHFQWGEQRELSRKNVERLKEMFRRIDDVDRLEPRNHIPAVVEQSDLDRATLASAISAETLLNNPGNDPPTLKFPPLFRLTCLHGRHRVQAAREILAPADAWWTVDLYLADSNPELRTTLIEEYSNEEKPSDGEIYRKVRKYEREGNVCFKRRWKARLTDHGRRGLRQLLEHGDGELTAAFDNLLDIPGLWDGMRLSTMHKILGMKCDEELLHYLEHVREVWNRLLGGDETALCRVDQATVQALQLRAPRHSRRDALLLEGQIVSGQIFHAFSREERQEIWPRVCSIDGLIPSLFGFFENAKYLEACADCLKRLVNVSRRDTVSRALKRNFPRTNDADGSSIIEVAESTFGVISGATSDLFDVGYRQLWLFAMRHYQEIPKETRRKGKDLLAKAGLQKADEDILSQFAALANRIGFESNKIRALKQRSSDREIALSALLKARKPGHYHYDETTLEANAELIVKMFATAAPLRRDSPDPILVSDNPNASGKRCGFPDEDAQQQHRQFLFLPYLYTQVREQGEDITSFFVRRSVYLAFFGALANPGIEDRVAAAQALSRARGTSSPADEGSEMDGMTRSDHRTLEPLAVAIRRELDQSDSEEPEEDELEQGRREQERREQEKMEQERREQERIEQERMEQERREQERIEQERMEQERQEQERQEQERQEQERQEQERQEQERQEQERQEQERQEQERRDQERQEQKRQEQERQEQERQDQERQDQERQEQERQEQERQEQKRQEQERQEQERQDQERQEQERRDQERQGQGTARSKKNPERGRDRHTQIDIESLISGHTRADRKDRLPPDASEKARRDHINDNQRVHGIPGLSSEPARKQSNTTDTNISQIPQTSGEHYSSGRDDRSSLVLQTSPVIRITYKIRERGVWRSAHVLDVSLSDTSEVERVAVKYMRKQIRLFDSELNILTPRDCFERATANGRNVVLLIPEKDIDISEELEASASKLVPDEHSDQEAPANKRGRH